MSAPRSLATVAIDTFIVVATVVGAVLAQDPGRLRELIRASKP